MSSVQLSETQFKELLDTIRALGPDYEKLEKEKATKRSKASFSNCKARYGGQCDVMVVENFITAIEMYKNSEEISDHDALRGISLLFEDLAATWWKGVRRHIKTWNELLEALREHFVPVKPIYEIYLEIFKEYQDDDDIDTFVLKKRAILSKLPEGLHDEETQLNFIYGLLNEKYRKHIPRLDIHSFQQLLDRGRNLDRNDSWY